MFASIFSNDSKTQGRIVPIAADPRLIAITYGAHVYYHHVDVCTLHAYIILRLTPTFACVAMLSVVSAAYYSPAKA